jgi:hypothetical protein
MRIFEFALGGETIAIERNRSCVDEDELHQFDSYGSYFPCASCHIYYCPASPFLLPRVCRQIKAECGTLGYVRTSSTRPRTLSLLILV